MKTTKYVYKSKNQKNQNLWKECGVFGYCLLKSKIKNLKVGNSKIDVKDLWKGFEIKMASALDTLRVTIIVFS